MSAAQFRFAGAGLFFLFIFLFGFWLSRLGRPRNAIILTIHKLISLAAVGFLGMTIYQINQVAQLDTIELTAGLVTGLFFLCTIILGGLVSLEKPVPGVISTLHKLFPYLTVLSTGVTLYLLQVPE